VDRSNFWGIVEGARAEAGTDTEHAAQVLLRHLRALPPADHEPFQEFWEQEQNQLYCWPIHDAATLLLGPLDDDSLLAVQDWILSHGRNTVQRILDDPDSIVELATDRHNACIDCSAVCPWRHTSPQLAAPCPLVGLTGLTSP
jgi:hypothetical protein